MNSESTEIIDKEGGGELTYISRTSISINLGRKTHRDLALEPRRALGIFKAVALKDDEDSIRILAATVGALPNVDSGDYEITLSHIETLAEILKDKAYPLTDSGIQRFKMERGFSSIVQITPDLAAAYSRFLGGFEARLSVSKERFAKLDIQEQRAIRILLLIGHLPRILVDVRRLLGMQEGQRAADQSIPVGAESGRALMSWLKRRGLELSEGGLRTLVRVSAVSGADQEAELARWVSDAIRMIDEPLDDYERIKSGSMAANKRTLWMLQDAERLLQAPIRNRLIKGSYRRGEDKGAHPHNGGGVVDLDVNNCGPESAEAIVTVLRQAGFAAWVRDRETERHIHAVAIGDKELTASAQWQVKMYFQGKDGRSRMHPDPHRHLGIALPNWISRYRFAYN
ncbi:hypothetical protein KAI87_03725 [Myxococcota bacterium]|nr:hypothetical protein [Myxococcota bacterium]